MLLLLCSSATLLLLHHQQNLQRIKNSWAQLYVLMEEEEAEKLT